MLDFLVALSMLCSVKISCVIWVTNASRLLLLIRSVSIANASFCSAILDFSASSAFSVGVRSAVDDSSFWRKGASFLCSASLLVRGYCPGAASAICFLIQSTDSSSASRISWLGCVLDLRKPCRISSQALAISMGSLKSTMDKLLFKVWNSRNSASTAWLSPVL